RLVLDIEDNHIKNSRLEGVSYAASIGDYDFGYLIPLSGDSLAYAYYELQQINAASVPVYLNPLTVQFDNEARVSADCWFLISEQDTIKTNMHGIKLQS